MITLVLMVVQSAALDEPLAVVGVELDGGTVDQHVDCHVAIVTSFWLRIPRRCPGPQPLLASARPRVLVQTPVKYLANDLAHAPQWYARLTRTLLGP